MELLFQQLGLDGTNKAVAHFIDKNAPIANDVEPHGADFWTGSQSECLKKMVDEDADWAEIADQLNVLLR
jgi:hypothetical protein